MKFPFVTLPCDKKGDCDVIVNANQIKYIEPSPITGARSYIYFGYDKENNDAWLCVKLPLAELLSVLGRMP